MSKLTTMQVISHLLVKIHNGQQDIKKIKEELDVFTNRQVPTEEDTLPSNNFEADTIYLHQDNVNYCSFVALA
jgi:hypothetical protein